MVSEHMQATLIGPRAPYSIQEMTHKTRANPAPFLHRKKKIQKLNLFVAGPTAAKFKTFVVCYPYKNASLRGRDRNACVICRSEGAVQESLAGRYRMSFIALPYDSRQPCFTVSENLWCLLLQCFNRPSRVCNIHIWRLRNPPVQPADIFQHWDGYRSAIPVAETTTEFLSLIFIFKLHYFLV